MSETLKAAVQEFYDRGWNRGDLSVIDDLFSPEYQDHDAAAQTGTSGLDGARQFIEIFRAAIPDLHVEIENQYAEGSTVTTRWMATGTHQGTLMGVPATHRRLEVSGISIDRFDEQGRFAEGWGSWDGIALLRQIGALPTASQ
ncbi:MAG: ester cyclase [Gaiellaceae bacterium]